MRSIRASGRSCDRPLALDSPLVRVVERRRSSRMLPSVISGACHTETKSMHSNEYYRLHATCFVMARQSELTDMRTRWLNMAQACLELANADEVQRGAASRVAGSKLARKKKLEDVH
jgi:hypothetical protein